MDPFTSTELIASIRSGDRVTILVDQKKLTGIAISCFNTYAVLSMRGARLPAWATAENIVSVRKFRRNY